MSEYKYIDRLRKAMENKYSKEYIQRCSDYAKKLLDKNLPVIYDGRHASEILELQQIKMECYHTFTIAGKINKEILQLPVMSLNGDRNGYLRKFWKNKM